MNFFSFISFKLMLSPIKYQRACWDLSNVKNATCSLYMLSLANPYRGGQRRLTHPLHTPSQNSQSAPTIHFLLFHCQTSLFPFHICTKIHIFFIHLFSSFHETIFCYHNSFIKFAPSLAYFNKPHSKFNLKKKQKKIKRIKFLT